MNNIGWIGRALNSISSQAKGGNKPATQKARGNKALSKGIQFGSGPFKGSSAAKRASGNTARSSKTNKRGSVIKAKDVKSNPAAIAKSGEAGVDVGGLKLSKDTDGKLSENSKIKVNKLIGHASSSLDSEVAAAVYDKGNGQLGTKLYTSKKREEVSLTPPKNTLYSAHTHPDMNRTPSQADKDSAIPGAEETVVPADDIVGNETGEYVQYAG